MAYNYFSGLFGSSKSAGSMSSIYGSLGDYNTIKSGSYKKLLKAYYKTNKSEKDTSSTKKTTEKKASLGTDTKELTTTKKYADQLSDAACKLVGNSNRSLYEEGQEKELLDKVGSFVSAYNKAVEQASDSSSKNVSNAAQNMVRNTESYAKSLESIGITIDDNAKLSVDQDKLQAADRTTVKRLLGGNNSFVATTMRMAADMSSKATTEASGVTTYSASGSYTALNLNSYFNEFM